MAGYNKLRSDTSKDFLNPYNIIYYLKKAYESEFHKTRSSFFQKVIEKDEFASRHFVGVVAAVRY
jgi:hypothetical protein